MIVGRSELVGGEPGPMVVAVTDRDVAALLDGRTLLYPAGGGQELVIFYAPDHDAALAVLRDRTAVDLSAFEAKRGGGA